MHLSAEVEAFHDCWPSLFVAQKWKDFRRHLIGLIVTAPSCDPVVSYSAPS